MTTYRDRWRVKLLELGIAMDDFQDVAGLLFDRDGMMRLEYLAGYEAAWEQLRDIRAELEEIRAEFQQRAKQSMSVAPSSKRARDETEG